MLSVPAFGFVLLFIAGYFLAEVSSYSDKDKKWERPRQETSNSSTTEVLDGRKIQKNIFRGVFPEIIVKVYDPNPSDTQVLHPVKVHVEPSPPEKLTLLSPRNQHIAPKGPKLAPADNFISASSNVMNYDDYPVGMTNQHHVPRTLNENRLPINPVEKPQTTVINVNGQSDQRIRKKSGNSKNRKKRVGKSIKGYLYMDKKTKSKKSPSNLEFKSNWYTLHSSRRVHVPVWRKGKFDSDDSSVTSRYCLQCPSNVTLFVSENKTTAIVPLASISICKSLARRKGKLNLAVISGPPPGVSLTAGEYPSNLIAWKFGGKVFSCRYTVIVKETVPEQKNITNHMKPCDAVTSPLNGRLICNLSPRDGFYQSGTICQFFCFPGFDSVSNDTLFVCNEGAWDPEVELSCTAASCPELARPEHGTVKCQSRNDQTPVTNNGQLNGAKCSYECDPGFVVPTSQSKLKHVECIGTLWNHTTVPECKQKIIPKPGPNECDSKTLVVARGTSAPLVFPKFYSEDELGNKRKVNVTCSHGLGKLVPGTHINRCTAYDAEYDSYGHCNYTVEVKAKSCPLPKRIPNSKTKCSLSGKPINNGYFPPDTECKISCENGYMFSDKMSYIYSRCLKNSRWNRSWRLSCKKVKTSCPALKAIPNGSVSCQAKAGGKNHSVSSVCKYECDQSYVMPTSQLPWVTRHCLPSGKWNVSKVPACELQLAPKPAADSCKDVNIESDDLAAVSLEAKFELKDENYINANCSPSAIVSYGSTNVTCTAFDDELRIYSSCKFVVIVTSPSGDNANVTSESSIIEEDEDQPPSLTGCEDQVVNYGNSSQMAVPQFKSKSNETMNASCSSIDFHSAGTQEVQCVADDPQTKLSSNCTLKVTILKDVNVTNPPELTANDTETPTQTGIEVTETAMSNVTDIQEDSPQVVEPGCVDQITESGFNFNVTLPEFITIRNTSAEVVCSPVDQDIVEVQTVSCEAVDPETNASSSCEFKVTVTYSNLRSHDVMEDITEALTREIYASLSQSVDCEALEAPSNGHLNCSSPDECFVSCDDGYGFSSSYPMLSDGNLTCNKTNGMWNFQEETEKIPDCLRELPSTSVEVWLGFSASVDNCSALDEPEKSLIKQKLLELNNGTCNLIDCDASLVINCSSDEDDNEENNSTVIVVTWNLKASYNPKDYKFNKKVPLAETQLESVLEDTKKAVQSEDSDFSLNLKNIGFEVLQNTFARGHMTLVCDERGFFVEPETDQCIECAAGHMEVKGSCLRCPTLQYQDKSGQTECKPCPTGLPSDEIPDGC